LTGGRLEVCGTGEVRKGRPDVANVGALLEAARAAQRSTVCTGVPGVDDLEGRVRGGRREDERAQGLATGVWRTAGSAAAATSPILTAPSPSQP